MADFPTLSQGALVEGFSVEPAFNPTLISGKEAGVFTTRPSTTVVPNRWRFRLSGLTDADKALLDTFFGTTVRWCGTAFTWENTDDGVSYSVILENVFTFSRHLPHKGIALKRWKTTEILLREASPTSS